MQSTTMMPESVVLTILLGLSSVILAREVQDALPGLLDKISTTIAEVAWKGKHNSGDQHNKVMNLLIKETFELSRPEITELHDLLEGANPEYLSEVKDRIVEESTRKLEALEDSEDDGLAPRLLCQVNRGVKRSLCGGVGGVVGNIIGLVAGFKTALLGGLMGNGCCCSQKTC